jgi:hypothetical protein
MTNEVNSQIAERAIHHRKEILKLNHRKPCAKRRRRKTWQRAREPAPTEHAVIITTS